MRGLLLKYRGLLFALPLCLLSSANENFTLTSVSPQLWTSITSSQNGDYVAAAAASGVFVSSDAGLTWGKRLNGSCESIASSSDGKTVLTSCSSTGLYRSLDYGSSWTSLSSVSADSLLLTSRAWLRMTGGLLSQSQDMGVSWTKTMTFSSPPYSIAASYDGTYILVASATDNLHISSDGGGSWSTPIKGLGFSGTR